MGVGYTFRAATTEDSSGLYEMLMAMHSGTIAGTSPVSPDKVREEIAYVLEFGDVLLAELDGRIIGSIAGAETSDWWSDEIHLADRWFFVYKEHRKSRAALSLVKSFLQVARRAEIKVKLGHVYSGDIARKDSFYERLGLSRVGSLYVDTYGSAAP